MQLNVSGKVDKWNDDTYKRKFVGIKYKPGYSSS